MFYLTYVRMVNWNLVPKNWLKLKFTLLGFFYFFYLFLLLSLSHQFVDVLTKRSLNWSFPPLILSTCVPHDLNDKENSILTCYFHKCNICLQNLKKSVFLLCVSEISMKNNVLFKQKAHFSAISHVLFFVIFLKQKKTLIHLITIL